MIFGGFKGLQPHGGIRSSVMVILGCIQFLSLFGYMGGFFDRTDRLVWHEFVWDQTAVISTVALCLLWPLSIFILLRAQIDQNTKLGGAVVISLPMAVFVALFFEFVTLGPR